MPFTTNDGSKADTAITATPTRGAPSFLTLSVSSVTQFLSRPPASPTLPHNVENSTLGPPGVSENSLASLKQQDTGKEDPSQLCETCDSVVPHSHLFSFNDRHYIPKTRGPRRPSKQNSHAIEARSLNTFPPFKEDSDAREAVK